MPDYNRRVRSPNRVNATTEKREWGPDTYANDRRTSSYTPLVTSVKHIFEVNKNKGLLRKSTPLSSWQRRNKKRYCEYHESSGHHTYECRQLKDEIEELIKEGFLTEWIIKEVKRYKDDPDRSKYRGRALDDEERENQEVSIPSLRDISSTEIVTTP